MKKIYSFLAAFLVLAIISLGIFPFSREKTRHILTDRSRLATGAISSAGRKIESYFSFFFSISKLKRQNAELAEKIVGLEVDRSKIAELEIENNLLKRELGFLDESKENTLIPAKIIIREPTSFLDSFVIDKGKDDGIVPGKAVISSGALIGQVGQVYDHTSIIIQITSKDSIIQAMLQGSRAKGVLKGGISGLYLENIMLDTDYKEGEAVVTSGLGGSMEQGILIGKTVNVQKNSTGIFKTIAVEPVVDLSKLELVFVQK
jgi:rod shape-determining protein MreC